MKLWEDFRNRRRIHNMAPVSQVRPYSKTKYEFLLSRPEQVYFIGETIEGDIKLTLYNNKLIKGMNIELNGDINIKFNSKRYSGERSLSERFMSITKEIPAESILETGEHMIHFTITPDSEGLTSCVEEWGRVTYDLCLVIFRHKLYDNIFNTSVTLIRPLNLNVYPLYKMPQLAETRRLCNLCGILGDEMYCVLKIPFRAYAPGQIVKYILEFHNLARERIESISVIFSKKLEFYANRPYPDAISAEVTIINQPLTFESFTFNIIEGEFQIPPTAPTSSRNGKLHVDYFLRSEVKMSSCMCKYLEAKIPIVIGTVPLKETLAPSISILIPPPTFEIDYQYDNLYYTNLVNTSPDKLDDRPRYPIYRIAEPSNKPSNEVLNAPSNESTNEPSTEQLNIRSVESYFD